MIHTHSQQTRSANLSVRTLIGCAVALTLLPGVPWLHSASAVGCGAKAFVVNSSADTSDALIGDEICADATGACTLRAAIEEGNADSCKDSVNFNIPGTDAGCNPITHVCTLTPASVLPTVSQPIVIMGDTQPGSQSNTLPNADNAVLLIELSGAALPAGSNGITITAGDSDVDGLVINRFAPSGSGSGSGGGAIVLSTNGSNRVFSNFIGTDPTGTMAYGNGRGVEISSGNNQVGGQAASLRNVISGNGRGINIVGTGAATNVVYNNFIGIQANGTATLGNTSSAGINVVGGASNNAIGGTFSDMPNVIAANIPSNIRLAGSTTANNVVAGNYIGTNAAGAVLGGGPILIDGAAHDNRIGGATPGAGNTIAYSIGKGIVVTAAGGTGNTILSNSIFGNASLGIDLNDEGVTANDFCDSDAGPNSQQNYPVLTAASSDGSTTTILGTLNSVAFATFTLQFFDSTSCDSSGYGQGQTLIGSTSVTPDVTCDATFEVSLPYGLALGHAVTATATDAAGNTSEFGPCVSGGLAPTATPSAPPLPTDAQTVTPTTTPTFPVPPITGTPGCIAKTFVVTSTADTGDASSGDGLCADATGNCTLRAAIDEANANSCADVINFNIPHSDSGCNPSDVPAWVCTTSPAADLPAITQPVTIDGYTQPGASPNTLADADDAVLQIQISGNGTSTTHGLVIAVGNSTVRGLVINGVTNEAILLEMGGGNVIEGNFVCTDPTGTFAPNVGEAHVCGSGVRITASADNRVGGTTPAARNILSAATGGPGLTIDSVGATNNLVQGNFIGLRADGSARLDNATNGVAIFNNAGGNIIGGTTSAARNIISGNGGANVQIGRGEISDHATSGNSVYGNYIGTDATGMSALGGDGVRIDGAWANMIGRDQAELGVIGNLISGNDLTGITLSNGAQANFIFANTIGNNAVGGGLGNPGSGVSLVDTDTSYNSIGGSGAGKGNTIARSGGAGIAASAGLYNSIVSNSIFGSGTLGIDLGSDGVTANDPCDGDDGPDRLQNYPVLSLVSGGGSTSTTTIAGTLDGSPSTSFTIQFFGNRNCDSSGYGEGHTLIGSTVVATDETCGATFNVSLPYALATERFVTATATDANGNTSEFSACRSACGDGVVGPGEQCDDGNNASGDGCGSTCVVESGWSCTGQPSTCTPPNGHTCTAGTQCTSGFCVDGVCCDSACGGGSTTDCQACSVAAGAATDGVCSPLNGVAMATATDGVLSPLPGWTCDDGSPCTTQDSCIAGTCIGTPLPAGTPCTDDGSACTEDACDASGTCLHSSPTAVYTLDADFEQGTLLSVNHDAPNHDQLQLSQPAAPFPFVNIAASVRGTIVRIDVNSGQVLGEYLTAPDSMGRSPSRTTVDQHGSVWVANRDEYGVSGGEYKGSVARMGLIIGGIRTDAAGTPDLNGQYLKPPFQYNTCIDRDGDGLFKTSRGLGNILAWTNAGLADADGGVSTAEDECTINYTRVTGTGTRTVAIDANNDLWVGGLGDLDHEKLNGLTGLPIPGTQFNLGCGGYGGLIDPAGVLWSARGGSGLLRFDTTALTGACLGVAMGDYGLGIDPQTGEVWQTDVYGGVVCKIAPNGIAIGCYPHGEQYAQGIAVDGSGNVWVAHALHAGSTTVGHLRTDGTFVGNVNLPGGSGPTGVAVDTNGKVWAANWGTDNAMRIDPSAGALGGGGVPIGAVDMTVSLGAGAGPYNYSDMTGFVAIGSTSPQGTWTVTRDGVVLGNVWGAVSWNTEPQASEPPGTSTLVEVRAANTLAALGGQPYTSVTNGGASGVSGRFLEVRATLKASPSGVSPVFSDLRVQVGCGATVCSTHEDCGDADGCTVDRCDPTNAAANSFGCVYTGIVCTAQDACHEAGRCNPVSGQCSSPAKADGAACTDSDLCNTDKSCQSGICTGGAPRSCDDENVCTVDACDAANGCTHTPGNAGVVCRPAAGECDVAETCDGSSPTCPIANNPGCTPTPGPCGPKIFVVTSTADTPDTTIGDTFCADAGGVCTLRAAIQEANVDNCVDTINFNIPSIDPGCNSSTQVCTITPATAYDTIQRPLTIDGYTQPGALPNSLTLSDNAVLLIEINGAGVPKGNHGLSIAAGSTTVRGLVINRFRRSDTGNIGGNAIDLMTNGGNIITGNFLGTDPTGTAALPNQRGVSMNNGSSGNVIGGSLPPLRNLASGNTGAGISIGGGTGIATANLVQNNLIGTQANGATALANGGGVYLIAAIGNRVGGTTSDLRNVIAANGMNVRLFNGASGNVIEGNYIGTSADGTAPLGGGGIVIDSTSADNMIGGTAPGAGNLIAHNATNGVTLTAAAGTGNSILSNSIYDNSSLGIDLGDDGITANDGCDVDTGPNAAQNYPVLIKVSTTGGNTMISGTLTSTANTASTIQFFDTNCDASGYGEGDTLIGSTVVATDGSCAAAFNVTFTYTLTAGRSVTATVTDAAGNTSEFSACRNACGDGAVRLDEQCDDGNAADGDGCSSNCVVESGWNCTGQPSTCTPPIGDSCTDPAQCSSGFCVDGVCCDSACGGGSSTDCQACSVAAGATADGVCGPLTGPTCDIGNDPCTLQPSCVAGACIGTPLAEGTPCTDDDNVCTQDVCDATGHCGHHSPAATYTLDADFEQGTLLSVNHDAPNHDQLQLSQPAKPFPFVNIAASARGTIVRIDVNSGQLLGEYQTAPDSMGRNPSRTTVDQHGSVWVANRDEYGFSGGEYKGSVARVGLVVGGIRTDAAGTPDANGHYLKPPFQYSTCVDRDSDGLLKTSQGLGDILTWTNAAGADSHGGVSTAEDECIITYTRVTGTGTRTIAVDANNDVWVGGTGDMDHEKISGLTGLPIRGTQFNLNCGGYGGLVDHNGILWSAREVLGLLRFDTTTLTGACLGVAMGDYGIGIDPQTGEIWQTSYSGGVVCRIAPAGTLVGCYPYGAPNARGVAVDGSGNVWVAHSGVSISVGHLRTDGSMVGVVNLPGALFPTGVAVDTNGKVWVTNTDSNNVMRIDPSAGPLGGGGFPIGAVDMTVSLGAGAGPYNYSDMTGFVAIGSTSPQGTWTVTRDGGIAGNAWGPITWNTEPQASEPAGTSIIVEARAANTLAALGSQAFTAVTNGGPSAVSGRFIEIRTTLKASPSGVSPVLSDLRVEVGCGATTCSTDADCGDADGCTVDRCDPNNAAANSFGCVYTGIVCTPQDDCHDTGTCNPVSGQCSGPAKADGTACTDSDLCNMDKTCQSGQCAGGWPVGCDDENVCTVDACDSANGCTHTPGNAGAVCRASAGECDVAETCDGSSPACPIDSNPACTPTPGACGPKIFVVTSTADTPDANVGDTFCGDAGGVCTLRAAIQEANVDNCVDTINFNIPSNDPGCNSSTQVCTITPASAYDTIQRPLTIDGYTQPGALPNSLTLSDNAVLLIEINGAGVPKGNHGLSIAAGSTTVRGLVINRFRRSDTGNIGGNAIDLVTNGGNIITGNFLGTDPTGTSALPNQRGVSMNNGSSGNVIGGSLPALRNLASGNTGAGVSIGGGTGITTANLVQNNFIGTQANGATALANGSGVNFIAAIGNRVGGTTSDLRNVIAANGMNVRLFNGASGNVIEGNYIGTSADGTAPLGGGGIVIDSTSADNMIGGTAPGAGNLIAHNATNGVTLTAAAGTGNSILSNSIYDNSSLGIDLGNDGVTANDACDVDTGPNAAQNYPVLTNISTSGGNTMISGTLTGTANTPFTIQFFETHCDALGYGEGHTLIGSTTVTTDASCAAAFNVDFAFALTHSVSATATDSAGNTSEFSACAATVLPTQTQTSTPTDTATSSPTQTATSTATQTASSSPTQTQTVTSTQTPTRTATHTPTAPAPSATITSTKTPTTTRSVTPTATPTITATGTNSPTSTPSSTPTTTATATPTPCLPEGAACNDGDACTLTDACHAGVCVGANPVVCVGDACHAAGTCEPATGECLNPVNVESAACQSCDDGLDNDDNGNTDAEDCACATLCQLQRFAVISSATSGRDLLYTGSDVATDSVAGSIDGSPAPYPLGNSRAGMCGNRLTIRAGGNFGILATVDRIGFGQGGIINPDPNDPTVDLGSVRAIDIRSEFVSAVGTREDQKTIAPLVGPGVCSDDLSTACTESEASCTSLSAAACCTAPAAICQGRLRLDTAGNPFVDRSGEAPNYQRCITALASMVPDTQAIAALAGNVPGYLASDNAQIRTGSQTPQLTLTLIGSGPHILEVRRVALPGNTELVLNAPSDAIVVIRVKRQFRLGGSAKITLAGGLTAEHVLWNVEGNLGGQPSLFRNSICRGTMLAAQRRGVRIGGDVQIEGAVFAPRVHIGAGSRVAHRPFIGLVP